MRTDGLENLDWIEQWQVTYPLLATTMIPFYRKFWV